MVKGIDTRGRAIFLFQMGNTHLLRLSKPYLELDEQIDGHLTRQHTHPLRPEFDSKLIKRSGRMRIPAPSPEQQEIQYPLYLRLWNSSTTVSL